MNLWYKELVGVDLERETGGNSLIRLIRERMEEDRATLERERETWQLTIGRV
jgi:hypothetical protein